MFKNNNELRLDNFDKKQILSASLKYFYEFGPSLALKYKLEKEIAQVNRVIELVFNSLEKGKPTSVSEFYQLADLEYSYYDKMSLNLDRNIKNIRYDIDNTSFIDSKRNIEYISQSMILVDPSTKQMAENLRSVSWPDLESKMVKMGPSIEDIDRLASINQKCLLLPNEVIVSTKDTGSIASKKDELVKVNKSLEEIKGDLEYMVLSLLEDSIIEN